VIKQVYRELEDCPVYSHNPLRTAEAVVQLEDAGDAAKKAELVLRQAHAEADRLLADANNRAISIAQEAYQKGWEKGEEEARQSLLKEQEKVYESSRLVLQQVEAVREKLYQETEAELLQLAIDIAEKLVCRQLDIQPDTVVDIAKLACTQARECKQIMIFARPEQVETLQARQGEIAAQLYNTQRLSIIADPAIEWGGCRVETEQGYIDANISTMLKQLEAVLKGEAS
jgi:flagellar assembly protein FliH